VGLGVVVGLLASQQPLGSTATAKWAVLASRRRRGLVAGATTTAIPVGGAVMAGVGFDAELMTASGL
jgi:hypothetical protein